jgi:type II secretory pathway component PulF
VFENTGCLVAVSETSSVVAVAFVPTTAEVICALSNHSIEVWCVLLFFFVLLEFTYVYVYSSCYQKKKLVR